MRHLDLDNMYYASKWSLTDFYEEAEKKLREAIESGEEFDTGWFGCKKEIRYARYEKSKDSFFIAVSAHMDDLWDSEDLIYDALNEIGIEEEVTEEVIDEIRDIAMEDGIEDEATVFSKLDSNASFDDVVRETEKAEEEAESINKDMYGRLCDIVREVVRSRRSE